MFKNFLRVLIGIIFGGFIFKFFKKGSAPITIDTSKTTTTIIEEHNIKLNEDEVKKIESLGPFEKIKRYRSNKGDIQWQ